MNFKFLFSFYFFILVNIVSSNKFSLIKKKANFGLKSLKFFKNSNKLQICSLFLSNFYLSYFVNTDQLNNNTFKINIRKYNEELEKTIPSKVDSLNQKLKKAFDLISEESKKFGLLKERKMSLRHNFSSKSCLYHFSSEASYFELFIPKEKEYEEFKSNLKILSDLSNDDDLKNIILKLDLLINNFNSELKTYFCKKNIEFDKKISFYYKRFFDNIDIEDFCEEIILYKKIEKNKENLRYQKFLFFPFVNIFGLAHYSFKNNSLHLLCPLAHLIYYFINFCFYKKLANFIFDKKLFKMIFCSIPFLLASVNLFNNYEKIY